MAPSPPLIVKLQPVDITRPRSARRVWVNSTVLKNAKIFAGDVVVVSQAGPSESFAAGVAWPSSEVSASDVFVSKSLLRTACLEEHQSVVLNAVDPRPIITPASELWLEEIKSLTGGQLQSCDQAPLKASSRDWLLLAAREALVDLRYVIHRQLIEVIFEGRSRYFRLVSAQAAKKNDLSLDLAARIHQLSLDSSHEDAKHIIWSVTWDTQAHFFQPKVDDKPPSPADTAVLSDPYGDVGGLDKEISQVRDLIEIPLTRPQLFRQFGLKPPRGILLYGSPGTGKTHLARTIATASGTSLLTISGPELSSAYHGETEEKLRDVFAEAKARSPCIIVIDEVDALCPKREDTGGGVEGRVVATLLTLMDGIDGQSIQDDPSANDIRVVVVATTNRPNAIDPALRRPGRFDREIEIGVPDATARLAILRVLLSKMPHTIGEKELIFIAKATHGYVGADLAAVVRTAGTEAIKRHLSVAMSSPALLTSDDLMQATTSHHPSALREHAIETPTTRWSDIGGQTLVKQRLKESVEWPLVHPEAFKRLGVSPPKGVLLYGPPGCSKTLTAKALASESGINFIAVKGPELLTKYVGESERAVREIFRKARAAAPSIIFFDEIDAIAASRSEHGESHEGVLTSLLNEMDGIQELIGVTVVAATNRPDVIDSALMRPGRLDRILYVGPPNYDSRKEILKIRAAKMAVDPELDLDELATLTDGCSGAEIASVCQIAALATMQHDINAPFVTRRDFIEAAKGIRRQITPEMIKDYELWRDGTGVSSA